MFDFKNANENQIEAITTVDGPVLITAGPGTGKTFTLVNRAIYMILERNINPENILIATFTEKAAKELITRISNELLNRGISVNINEMYVGTFHSICLRMLKEKIEFTDLKKNYTILDAFDQKYFIYQNLAKFRNLENYNLVIGEIPSWAQADQISRYVNNLEEELIDLNQMERSKDLSMVALAKIARLYISLLKNRNSLDFSSIQTYALKLFEDNPKILDEYRDKLKFIMIDEYQDTNYVQEQLIFKLGNKSKNICVVGDDDQGLYRFRGATIRNILEFPQKFKSEECKIISLTMNYRSDSQIIDFYNKWMATTKGRKFKFDWSNFRFDKTIEAPVPSSKVSPTVTKLSGDDDIDDWHKKVLNFIEDLKRSGSISNLNQIAFLFNSVKNEQVQKLANFLEGNGIGVYAPRSDMFFEREEIKLAIGILLILFPHYVQKIDERSIPWMQENFYDYYENAILIAGEYLKKQKDPWLLKWIQETGIRHMNPTRNTDYAFSGLLYQMFEFEPFHTYLSIDLSNGILEQREARNLAIFSELLAKFEYAHSITVFTAKNIEYTVNRFFNGFLKFLILGGIGEYEDNSEYAPSGCVSFLTIHQAKGMEFPVVIVGSLGNVPRNRDIGLMDVVYEKYQRRESFEPAETIKFFDFWRLYYTAFSRAQDLLVLTCNVHAGQGASPSKYFNDLYQILPEFNTATVDLNEFKFHDVKDVNLKNSYSFTSDITVYNNCSVQYKFFKELGFIPIRVGSTVFGMLVHQTIEDIHKSALRSEEAKINKENIKKWFDSNYSSIVNREHTYLAEGQLNAALKQVYRYVERQGNDWSKIQEAEVEVSLVKENYILEGKIDLIKGEGETVEIVDFKSEKKPDLVKNRDTIEHYKKQLQIYAYLVEEKTGKKVSRINLYYTGAENENPVISFSKLNSSISQTVKEFDDIVDMIQKRSFNKKSENQNLCNNCDLRHFCKR